VKHLQVEQVQALRAAAETDRNKLFLTIIYEHGLRVSEALSLTRAHVRRGYLQIKGKKKGKRADEKVNPATLALFESVTKNLLPNTLIFPFSRQWGSELFHAAAAKAGIELQLRQGIHSLRHSLAHHMLDSGAPLPVVQRALRHKSIGSTGVYLEADASATDVWRSKATAPVLHVHGTVAVPTLMSLAAIQAEMQRLAALAVQMQAAQTPVAQAVEVAPTESERV
jgi:site-specific recombinase XerD